MHAWMHAWLVHRTKLVAVHEASNYATYKLERAGKTCCKIPIAIALSFEGKIM